MNTMTYKGFIGSVSFSDKDNLFFGKIEGINGVVNFEDESVSELKRAFHEAVNDYLAYCESESIQAHKSYSGMLNVLISPKTYSCIAMFASKVGISVNAFMKQALDKAVIP